MAANMEQLYLERLGRYTTALRNEKPDRVPIRPFVAEFTAKYAGYTCQEVTQDYELAFAAARKCAADFDWDAVVGNMVYVWTGLAQAIGLKYYAAPGVEIPPQTGFQYIEPAENNAWMRPDEYDQLIEDPTGYLFNVWLPRVAAPVSEIGAPATFENNLSFLKGGMAMLKYFMAFGDQARRLREESGTASAIAGILKAPMDIIADKLRGYLGLLDDLQNRPKKVLAACEALAPHLFNVALGSSDPTGMAPIGYWMHRGCVPFVNPQTFNNIYWPTMKPIVQELWRNGRQTLFYAEGNWDHHLDSFAELPDRSIVYHVDQGDIFKAHRRFGDKFCLSGGLPNVLLGYGTEQQVRDACRKIIDGVARDGGYVMDASAIVQNDAKVENIRAMTDFTREYGVYSDGHSAPPARALEPQTTAALKFGRGTRRAPGVCTPWQEKKSGMPPISGDEAIVKRIWEENDGLGNMYIWQVLLSF
ncbi:MAG TPA: uroporphyrinogen decarboxylase family protein [Candidatus Brocadiia bacterium]|nr:uroporphyrinogen decarboxylase family protein [Candidatus Brocadiia bacterium]